MVRKGGEVVKVALRWRGRGSALRRKAETYHFKGISLLTSLGALNMMEFTFVIGISQVTGMPMNCLKIWKEVSNSRQAWDIIAHLDTPAIILTRSLFLSSSRRLLLYL